MSVPHSENALPAVATPVAKPQNSQSAPPPGVVEGNLASASRLIRASVYRREEDAALRAAGDELVALLDTLIDPGNPGPQKDEPKLALRNRKNPKGRYLAPMIVIQHGASFTRTTGVRAARGEDFTKNPRALAKLADYNYRRRVDAFAERFGHAVTVGDVIDEYLEDREPKTAAMKKAHGKRYDQLSEHGAQLAEVLRHRTLGDPSFKNVGYDYANYRTGQQKRNQSPSNPNPTNVKLETAIMHLKSLRQMLRHHADKWGRAAKRFDMPSAEETGLRWINWYQLMQLLLACRGYQFDELGNLLREAVTSPDGKIKWVPRRLPREEWENFEMIERFIILYLFGMRHKKNLQTRWHHSADFGYIDFVNGILVRSGQTAPLTNKEALPSKLLGSLERFARKWKRKDDARGIKYVIHHVDGTPRRSSLAGPFARVAKNAGIPWFTPHMLKHTGVTLMAYAGMPAPAISKAFSTTIKTLFESYTHLIPVWTHGSTVAWKPENACLLALKKVSPQPEGYPRVGGSLPE
jgi:integrase